MAIPSAINPKIMDINIFLYTLWCYKICRNNISFSLEKAHSSERKLGSSKILFLLQRRLIEASKLFLFWYEGIGCLSHESFLWMDGPGFKNDFLLMFACWEICVLVPHQIDLCHLRITCHLCDVSGSHLWTLHFLSKLSNLTCWELVQSILLSFMVLDTNSSSLRKKQKISL